MSPRQLSLVVVFLGIAAGFVASVVVEPDVAPSSDIEWITTPRTVAEFELQSTAGHISNAIFQGHWTLVGLGYLSCPNACPTMLSEVGDLVAELSLPVQILFISVDPAHDSISDLNSYLAHVNAGFVGAVGDDAMTARLLKSLGAQYTARSSGGVIGHSIQYAIVGPHGKLRGLLRPGFDVVKTAEDLSRQVLTVGAQNLLSEREGDYRSTDPSGVIRLREPQPRGQFFLLGYHHKTE